MSAGVGAAAGVIAAAAPALAAGVVAAAAGAVAAAAQAPAAGVRTIFLSKCWSTVHLNEQMATDMFMSCKPSILVASGLYHVCEC